MYRHTEYKLSALEKLFSWLLNTNDFSGKYFLIRMIKKFSPTNIYLKSNYDFIIKENLNDLTWRLNYFGYKNTTVYDEIKNIPKGACFIDIGANIGTFSMIADKAIGESGLIICFEPNPVIYSDLIKNLSANNLNANILPLNMAISGETLLGSLTYDPTHSGVSHLSGESGNDLGVFVAKWHDLRFIEKLIGERDIYIKIDVGGAEAAVLQSIETLIIGKNIKKVIVELDDEYLERFGDSKKVVYTLMEKFGFSAKFNYSKKHYDEVFQKI